MINKDPRLDGAIGHRVALARKKQGLTLEVLAERARVHRNTVDNCECGRGVSVSTLVRIAAALGVKLDALAPISQCSVQAPKNVQKVEEKTDTVVSGTGDLFS